MQSYEISLNNCKLDLIVQASLLNNIQGLLTTIYRCSKGTAFIICLQDLRKRIYHNITTDSDLYDPKNRHIILDIYNLLYYLINVSQYSLEDLIFDYNIWWELNTGHHKSLENDGILNELVFMSAKMVEIIKLDYEKMKKENRKFSQELLKCVFEPERITRFSKQYGLQDFTEYLDLLDL